MHLCSRRAFSLFFIDQVESAPLRSHAMRHYDSPVYTSCSMQRSLYLNQDYLWRLLAICLASSLRGYVAASGFHYELAFGFLHCWRDFKLELAQAAIILFV